MRQFSGADATAAISIAAPQAGDLAGFRKLVVTIAQRTQTKSFDFYLSDDGKRLLYANFFDMTVDPYAQVMKQIDLAGRPVRGPANAPVTLVLYDDYQCPFCAEFYATLMNEVTGKYADSVRVVTRDFPVSSAHHWARHAAANADCLADEAPVAFWQFTDAVHSHLDLLNHKYADPFSAKAYVLGSDPRFNALDQLTMQFGTAAGAPEQKLRACIVASDQRPIDASVAEGTKIGFGATPGIVINGEMLDGAISAEQLDAAIDRALRDASSQKP